MVTFLYVQGIDWKCTCYMISEIQYGGRVTDDYDLRLLKCLTRNNFQEPMFSHDYVMVDHYPIPLFPLTTDYTNYIKNDLPPRDSPEAFGLHANADINYSTQTTRKILATIVSIQPKDSGGDSGDGDDDASESSGPAQKANVETRESIVHRICTEMLKKLPPPYVDFQVAAQLKLLGALRPMTIFLRQEVQRMNKVIKLVLATLTDLRLAIDGTVVMNDDLRDALDCIYDAQVPAFWIRVSSAAEGNPFSHECIGTLCELFYFSHPGIRQLLVSGTLSYWRGTLNSRPGSKRVARHPSG